MATFSCNPGYEVEGPMNSTCSAENWSNQAPVCRGKYDSVLVILDEIPLPTKVSVPFNGLHFQLKTVLFLILKME